MIKRIVSVMAVALVLFTMFAIPVSAASKKSVGLNPNCGWSSTVKCTLNKNIWGKPKNGVVRVSINNWGVNVDIRMSNGGRTIWSQNNAIKSSGKAASVYRDFSLGNDHSYYDLSFRCSRKCWAAPTVTVTNQSNCNIT